MNLNFKVRVALGWFCGENFRLFSLTIGELDDGWLILVDFQIAKLSLQISLDFSS